MVILKDRCEKANLKTNSRPKNKLTKKHKNTQKTTRENSQHAIGLVRLKMA